VIRDDPEEAWKWLMEGNRQYIEGQNTRGPRRTTTEVRDRLTRGQNPIATVLTCSDSRISPSLAFACGPGDLFVVRNAGNVLTDGAIASIEYGCAHAGSPILLILGHQSCGAVTAAVGHIVDKETGLPEHSCIPTILDKMRATIQPTIDSAPEDVDRTELIDMAVRQHARATLANVLKECAVVRKLVEEGHVRVYCGYYALGTGLVTVLDP
ncbi:mtcA2, partial [Symbiodinium sp. KB8]